MSDAFASTENAVLSAMREEAQRRSRARWLSAGGLIVAVTLALVTARTPRGGAFFAVAIASIALSSLLLLWRRTSRMLFLVCAAASVGFTLMAAGSDHALVAGGMHCAMLELVTALLPCLAVLVAARRNRDPIDVWRLAQTAVLGGLGGQAALLVACPSNEAVGHLLLFHNFGLVAAAALIAGYAAIARRRQL